MVLSGTWNLGWGSRGERRKEGDKPIRIDCLRLTLVILQTRIVCSCFAYSGERNME